MANKTGQLRPGWPWGGAIALSLLLGTPGQLPAGASTPDSAQALDPLEFPQEPDPLVPRGVTVENPRFNPRQRNEFERGLTALERAAAAALAAGDAETAFATWYRLLRLQRYLGPVAEVQALGRVGETAWEQGLSVDLQRIRDRLEAIEAEATEADTPDPALIVALAEAYARIRLQSQAVARYEQIAVQLRALGDRQRLARVLNQLAQLQTAWFRYEEAAAAYQELVAIAQTEFDAAAETYYLEQLAYLHGESEQWEAAIATLQQLAEQYFLKERWPELANLYITMGDAYARLEELEAARQSYQQAFTVAWPQQQYAYASDALTQLAELYVRVEQFDAALQVYQEQLKAAQAAQNVYGLMVSYERLGDLYLQLGDYGQAEAAFQAALELARDLEHQERHFENRLAEVAAARDR